MSRAPGKRAPALRRIPRAANGPPGSRRSARRRNRRRPAATGRPSLRGRGRPPAGVPGSRRAERGPSTPSGSRGTNGSLAGKTSRLPLRVPSGRGRLLEGSLHWSEAPRSPLRAGARPPGSSRPPAGPPIAFRHRRAGAGMASSPRPRRGSCAPAGAPRESLPPPGRPRPAPARRRTRRRPRPPGRNFARRRGRHSRARGPRVRAGSGACPARGGPPRGARRKPALCPLLPLPPKLHDKLLAAHINPAEIQLEHHNLLWLRCPVGSPTLYPSPADLANTGSKRASDSLRHRRRGRGSTFRL